MKKNTEIDKNFQKFTLKKLLGIKAKLINYKNFKNDFLLSILIK